MGINVTHTSMPSFEEYCEEIRKLWDSHYLTNMGVEHQLLQSKLQQFLKTPLALFANGHLALEAALSVLNLPKGGEVVTTPFTFASTTHAIVRKGLKPVFCDIRPDDATMDPDKAAKLINERTVALLPVHVYGNVCDVEAFDNLARQHHLKVIYDAAHAFGVTFNGMPAVTFGDLAILRVQFPRHEGVFHRRGRGCVLPRLGLGAEARRRGQFRHTRHRALHCCWWKRKNERVGGCHGTVQSEAFP